MNLTPYIPHLYSLKGQDEGLLYVIRQNLYDTLPLRHEFGRWDKMGLLYQYYGGIGFDGHLEIGGMLVIPSEMGWIPTSLVRRGKREWHLKLLDGSISCKAQIKISEQMDFPTNEVICSKQKFNGAQVCQTCVSLMRRRVAKPADTIGRATHFFVAMIPDSIRRDLMLTDATSGTFCVIETTIDGQYCDRCKPNHHGGGHRAAPSARI